MFGSLAQRGVANTEQTLGPERKRTRHVFVTVKAHTEIHIRPGVLLDWAREPLGWIGRVAYVADEDGTLIVAWFPAEQLTPVHE